MCKVARRVIADAGLDVTLPDSLIGVKRLKRLSEKMSDARKERGLEEWPGRAREYLAFSHCFYILDTVRLSFVCNGETVQEQVACCLQLLDGFKSCCLENDRLQVLRIKSGFASGVTGSGGYADVKVLVYADLGMYKAFDGTEIPLRIIGEVQLILHAYFEVKTRMHLAYEVNRGSFDHMVHAKPDSPSSVWATSAAAEHWLKTTQARQSSKERQASKEEIAPPDVSRTKTV